MYAGETSIMNVRYLLPILGLALATPALQAQTLKTRWTAGVSPQNVHREYPRPQMVRKDWINLNGLWDVAITPDFAGKPKSYSKEILVPFPVESQLSRVMGKVTDHDTVWYHRTFPRPKGERILLHFGAVDWDATVWVNGKQVASHQGGYTPFTADITDALKKSGPQELVVSVKDPTDSSFQPRGKQVRRPGGIMYTSTTGIWQTVWLEAVPAVSISNLRITPKINGSVHLALTAEGGPAQNAWAEVWSGGKRILRAKGGDGTIDFKVPDPKLWSPSSPFLYKLKVGMGKDVVDSYFALREISVGKAPDGKTRILLNRKPLFMVGPLDQGFWPDGLYTAPSEEAMIYDLKVTKQLGFNMIRKHVKVEPDTWYAACDRMGIVVWQDMPSGDDGIGGNDPDLKRSPASAAIYERELKEMVNALYSHPCIVMWVVFNEGWGQFDTPRIVKLTRGLDPTRLVDNASGWTDRQVGDVHDIHVYPGPGSPNPEPLRAAVLGEFGGLGLVTPKHMWQATGWGYQSYKTKGELTAAMVTLFEDLHLLIRSPGLSAAVYTQTTDVETELNGLMTYDRELIKPDAKRLRQAVDALFTPAPTIRTLVPTGQTWRYTLEKPTAGWTQPRFNDSAWTSGRGGFGTPETPGAVIGTPWSGKDIWLRRSFDLATPISGDGLRLLIHHDDAAQVYIDGVLAWNSNGWTSQFQMFPLNLTTLAKGKHTFAVHCHQDEGGQFIDVGIAKISKGR